MQNVCEKCVENKDVCQECLSRKFTDLFDSNSEDEMHYLAQIPKCDPIPLRNHLQTWVLQIRNYPFTQTQFARFKLDVLEYKLPNFVVWSTPSLKPKTHPYVMFDLQWDALNDSKNVFLAFMMIENTRIQLPRLKPSMWNLIPEPSNK